MMAKGSSMQFKSHFLQECEKRGFLNQCTNMEELDRQLSEGEPVIAYWGTDLTGPSLHVGHLFSLMMIRLFQRCGNKPIILLGGATTQIGDPSFRDKSRPMLSKETIEENRRGIRKSVEKFIKFGSGATDALLVNNADWWNDKKYMDVLAEIAPHLSVNRMLSFESVKIRLQKEGHMSFLEFNYMVLQAYDFYHLYKKYGCSVQLCGADQWGNVVAGVELVRRLQFIKNEVEKGERTEVMGLSTPLLTDANGKKLGKSEGNAVWTNEELLRPFDYFQYFRNVNDADVLKFLKVYTDMEVEEVDSLAAKKDINELKKILAYEATKICHGEENADECLERSIDIFENRNRDNLDRVSYDFDDNGRLLYILLKNLEFAKSNGEARRLIAGGAVSIDGERIGEELFEVKKDSFVLSVGKKKMIRVN